MHRRDGNGALPGLRRLGSRWTGSARRLREAGLSGSLYVVTDSNVHRHYVDPVAKALSGAGFAVHTRVVPAGEASKTLERASEIYDWLTPHKAERGQGVVAVGGGVIGDLAGFVAATYLRGLPLVQVPTSLLAMVDASIGGKTAVNQREAKNLVGAFYQPLLVFADMAALRTLPERELTSGWAEVIKHALIMDANLLALLEDRVDALRALEPDATTQVVRRSMALKAQVVAEDEREMTGRRSILNYGHTVGHALEAAAGYGALLHGEAVALGDGCRGGDRTSPGTDAAGAGRAAEGAAGALRALATASGDVGGGRSRCNGPRQEGQRQEHSLGAACGRGEAGPAERRPAAAGARGRRSAVGRPSSEGERV